MIKVPRTSKCPRKFMLKKDREQKKCVRKEKRKTQKTHSSAGSIRCRGIEPTVRPLQVKTELTSCFQLTLLSHFPSLVPRQVLVQATSLSIRIDFMAPSTITS